ncbi:MAG: ribosome maturation factor RimP [Pseudomonadaceae bacterium]|nr:ribosome maturation factor RimP [Pseudomonadaceae bacterium]
MTTLDTKLTQMATQAMAAHGLALVCARTTGGGKYMTVQVLVEKPDGKGGFASPTLDECTAASRTLAAQLDVADLIATRYTLEVGSPGMERPLMSVADCTRFIGKQAKFKFKHGTQTVGAVTGTIDAVEGETITLTPADGTPQTSFSFADVHAAQLSPSEADYAAFMKQKPRSTEDQPTE